MLLTFSSQIEASDQERRVIAGQVVPFDQVGMTSAGPVIFKRGSISIVDPNKIKLLANHDNKEVVGRATSFHTTDTGIYGSFKVSASSKGTDYLILAAEDLVSGLSVGVDVIKSAPDTKGNLVVTAGRLIEVSLVEAPAFAAAQIDRVAASETTQTEPTKESEAVMTTAPEAPQEEIKAEEAPVVEAARPRITQPTYNTMARNPITSAGRYTEHKIKAALGNFDSALFVKAADDSMATNPAFNKVNYLSEFITNTAFGTPVKDSCSSGELPDNGMTFSVPSLVTSAGGQSGVAPAVTVEAEAGAVQNTGMVTEFLTGTISKYSGMNTMSIELIERSSPIFFDELTRQLQNAYILATENAIVAELTASGTAATAQAATAAGLIAYVAKETPAAYSGTSYVAKNYLAGVSQWGLLIGATDTTGRPIFTAAQPMNAGGAAAPTSIYGNVLGLDLRVSTRVVDTTIDESAFIIVPEAVTVYSSPTAYMSVNIVANLQVQTAIYGYQSVIVKMPTGVRRYNLT